MNFVEISTVGILQSGADILPCRLAALLHQINQRQSRFTFRQIIADIFTDLFHTTRIIQHIVHNLKCSSHIHAELFECPFLFIIGTGQNRTDLCRRFKKFGRFILNHLQILLLGNIHIADIHQLHHFAFGNDVGCIGHHFQNFQTTRTHHQLKSARIQKVAHQHCRRIAKQVIGSFTTAP